MATVIKISRKSNPESVRKALQKLARTKKKGKRTKLGDFYGAGKSIYEDGLTYQKKQRDEWK